MKMYALYGGLSTVVVLVVLFAAQQLYAPTVDDEIAPVATGTGAEAAESIGFGFVQDVLTASSDNADPVAAKRAYAALSERAQASASDDVADLAAFMDLQEVPEQGARVEDLVLEGDRAIRVIVGLNYDGDSSYRAVDLIIEEDSWKVNAVSSLDSYPPINDTDPTPPGLPDDPEPVSDADGDDVAVDEGDGCYVGGCSAQVCSDDPDVMTTCEWREEYACYSDTTCERQPDGECGWTPTEDLEQCLADAADSPGVESEPPQ